MTKKPKPQSEIEYIENYIDELQNGLNKIDERLPSLKEKVTELETDKMVIKDLIVTVKKMMEDKISKAEEDFKHDMVKLDQDRIN
jgi:chromosome segregation ATPase